MLNQTAALDRMFSALAHPTRRRIIARLAQGPTSVSELAEPLPVSLPSVVQHLQVLTDGGLVQSKKTGRVRTYKLEPGALKTARNWLDEQRDIWEARTDRLEQFLLESEDRND